MSAVKRRRLECSAMTEIKNFITGTANYVRVQMLIDTGASRSCISESFFQRISATLEKAPLINNEPTHLRAANGSNLLVVGTANLKLCIDGLVIFHDFHVVRDLSHKVILGMTFLQECSADISLQHTHLSLFDGLVVTPLITELDELNALKLINSVKIPAYTEAVLPVSFNAKQKPGLSCTEPIQSWRSKLIGVARCLVNPVGSTTVCRLINLSNRPRYLRRGAVLAYLSPVDANDPHNARVLHGNFEKSKFVSNIDSAVDTVTHEQKVKDLEDRGLNFKKCTLTPDEFKQLIQLVYSYLSLIHI